LDHKGASTKEASAAAELAFKPFGTGRHLCFGYQLTLLVMKASLYVFAKDKRRTIKFDEESVKIENGLFPEAAQGFWRVTCTWTGCACLELVLEIYTHKNTLILDNNS